MVCHHRRLASASFPKTRTRPPSSSDECKLRPMRIQGMAVVARPLMVGATVPVDLSRIATDVERTFADRGSLASGMHKPVEARVPGRGANDEGGRQMPRVVVRVGVLVVWALVACDRGSAVTQPIAFDHKAHIDSGLECSFCHD